MTSAMVERRQIVVDGIVQGVGFRPFVHVLATAGGLSGSVCNAAAGVTIEVQGDRGALEAFVRRLRDELPPGARIERFESAPLAVVDEEVGFVIERSVDAGSRSISVAPDHAVCAACLAELVEPSDRRYRYPFISCAHCGPRYTIVDELPFDRSTTTMEAFGLCPACERDYRDASDRRFHAQTVACADCGPRVWLAQPQAADVEPPAGAGDPIAEAIAHLEGGRVLAVKGIGGFHLAANARDDGAVARLRELKRRLRKPLAVMVRDLETARTMVALDADTEQLLASPAAPIVVAPARPGHGLAEGVAPGIADLGVMLPYSPLHWLLFDGPLDALVMTSGNRASEPITTDNDEAMAELPAEAFLLHDRDIRAGCDDSVARATVLGPLFVRRSRGYVPTSLAASQLPNRCAIGLGAELKVTVTVLRDRRLRVGRHLGDLDDARTDAAFREEVQRTLRLGRLEPEAVAVDLHPDLGSTRYAEEAFAALPIFRIQHHHAHMLAVLAEHGLPPDAEVAAVVLDGFGYGPDGSIWGGEVLTGGYFGYQRFGHLRCVPQPGGDRAAREPRRMATSLLRDADLQSEGLPVFDERIAEICAIAVASPRTSSAGRLFDGAAAILGVAPAEQDYEAEAAIRLEAVADPRCGDAYPLPVDGDELDTRALIEALVRDRADLPTRAARFHNGLADGLAAMALDASRDTVALAGGCMANRLLLTRLVERLRAAGVRVLWPQQLPPGDGGLSAGQVAAASCQLDRGDS